MAHWKQFRSTDASVSLVSFTVGITVERPSFLCIVQRKRKHRLGISSLLLTLEFCSVALSFSLPYLLPPTREVCFTVLYRASPWRSSALGQSSTSHDQCSLHPKPNLLSWKVTKPCGGMPHPVLFSPYEELSGAGSPVVVYSSLVTGDAGHHNTGGGCSPINQTSTQTTGAAWD